MSVSYWNSVILLILTFSVIVNNVNADCSDPLSCVLDSIYIPLPNATIPLTGDAVLYLTNLYCTDVAIQSYPSMYVPPTSLGISVNGMHVYCQGHYVYDTGRRVSYQGLMEAVIKNTNVSMDYYLQKDPSSEFAEAMSIPSCNFTSMVIDVEFNGDHSVDFSQLANAVQALLTAVLKQVVCVSLPELVAINGTQALIDTINPALEVIIANGPSTVPQMPFDYISWSDTVLGLMSKVVDAQLADTIHSCVTEIFPAYTAMPWIDVLIGMITNSSGVIVVDVNSSIPVKNGTFVIDAVSLVGLNSFKTIDLIQPSSTSNISLTTTLELDKLQIILNTTTKSSAEQDYTESRQFTFAISNVTMVLDLAFGINKTHVDSLYFDQFMDYGCIMQSIGYLNISSLVADLTIDEISLVQVSGGAAILEQNLVQLVDNAFLLVTDGFGELVTDVLRGIFQGPVRAAINEKITASVTAGRQNSTCEGHVPYVNTTAATYVMWYNSTMIQMVDKFVNDATGINKLMSCISNQAGSLTIDREFWSLQIDGLTSFYNLSLMSPFPDASPTYHPYDLLNSLGLGYCPDKIGSVCSPFALKFVAKAAQYDWLNSLYHALVSVGNTEGGMLDYSDMVVNFLSSLVYPQLATELSVHSGGTVKAPSRPIIPAGTTIALSMENFYLYIDLFAQMNKAALSNVQILQKGTTGCVAQAFNEIAIENLTLAVSNVSLVINDGTKVKDLTKMLTAVFDILTRPSRIEYTNQKIATELNNAAVACENGGIVPFTDDAISDNVEKATWQWEMILLICGCVLSLVGLMYVYYYWGRTGKIRCLRPQKGVDSFPIDENGREIVDDRSLYERWGFEDALICQIKLPRVLRVGIVLAVIGDMICFLMSNLDPNAVLVVAEVDLASLVISPPPVFAFGLKSTVQDSKSESVLRMFSVIFLVIFL
jgi:hypothetical protein